MRNSNFTTFQLDESFDAFFHSDFPLRKIGFLRIFRRVYYGYWSFQRRLKGVSSTTSLGVPWPLARYSSAFHVSCVRPL